jgi:DNA-binding transcriptional MocR family regulator
VLRAQDIVVLLKLAGRPGDWTLRSLAAETGLARNGIHRSLQRLDEAGLYDIARRRANASQAQEFLVHGARYLFPPELGGETRGIETAWAAEPLASRLAPQSDLPPVWPHPHARQRGIALKPLHEAVPDAASRDEALRERLALVDALRLGDARLRGLAAELLAERLIPAPPDP